MNSKQTVTPHDRIARLNKCVEAYGSDSCINIRLLVELAGAALGGACALYSRLDGDMLSTHAAWQAPHDFSPRSKADGHICHNLILSANNDVLVVRNLKQTPYAQSDPNVLKYDFATYIGKAVWINDQAVGTVCVVFQHDFTPRQDDLDFLSIIAAGIAREEQREMLENQLRQSRKMEALGQLAGGVAHDFNNNLQVIMGLSEIVMKAMPSDHRTITDVSEILKAAKRAAELTRQLLIFSRQQTIKPQVLDINVAITNCLKMLSRLIGENIHLNFSAPEQLWKICMDAGQLDQILTNLAVNSRDAITGTGHIAIEAANRTLRAADCWNQLDVINPGDYVVVTFRDDGGGIPPAVQAHIFEPFFTTKGKGKGTGLGLATVYGIVKQNNGAITIHSSPGQGTTFTIYLPRFNTMRRIEIDPLLEFLPTGTETILIVEDDEDVLSVAQKSLTQLGYTVLTATKPGDALLLFELLTDPIHLLLVDAIMPKMGGKEFVERIKILQPDIPVLYMTGYPVNILEQKGQIEIGVPVMKKPFTNADLSLSVRNVLDGRHATEKQERHSARQSSQSPSHSSQL